MSMSLSIEKARIITIKVRSSKQDLWAILIIGIVSKDQVLISCLFKFLLPNHENEVEFNSFLLKVLIPFSINKGNIQEINIMKKEKSLQNIFSSENHHYWKSLKSFRTWLNNNEKVHRIELTNLQRIQERILQWMMQSWSHKHLLTFIL